jgi:hypothetical protein
MHVVIAAKPIKKGEEIILSRFGSTMGCKGSIKPWELNITPLLQ